MRKNNMLRIASVLLVAVLLTTCAISGVFANYQTKDDLADDAIVAKWGVEIAVSEQNSESDKLFQKQYAIDTTGLKDASENVIDLAVKAADGNNKNLVAPGTSDDGYKYVVSGAPEVAVEYVQVLTMELGDNWMADGAFYCPIVVTVNGVEFCGLDYTSAGDFETAVNAAGSVTKNYAPNSDLANTLTYSWKWEFAGQTDKQGVVKQTVEKDTLLGDAAADGNAATIEITSSITVTQIN